MAEYAVTKEQAQLISGGQMEVQAASQAFNATLRAILAGHGITQIPPNLEWDADAGLLRIPEPESDESDS